jgi:hypothetical protein
MRSAIERGVLGKPLNEPNPWVLVPISSMPMNNVSTIDSNATAGHTERRYTLIFATAMVSLIKARPGHHRQPAQSSFAKVGLLNTLILKDVQSMKTLRSAFPLGLAISAMMLLSAAAKADIYGSTGVRSGAETIGINYATGGLNGTYSADYYTDLSSNSSGTPHTYYDSFCVDLLHEATTTYTKLGTTALPVLPVTNTYATGGYTTTPNGAASFGWAAWLADHYYYSANNMDKQAGLQIAIWKILYETQTTYENNLSHGDITFSGNSNAMAAAVNYINDWITAGKPSDNAYIVNYSGTESGHAQYQLLPVSAPEPSTLAIAGLSAIALVAYHLKRRRA